MIDIKKGNKSDSLSLDVKIIRNSRKVLKIIFWVWYRMVCWKCKLHSLYHGHKEDEDLISCQQLSHAVPLTNTEGDYPLILNEPEQKKIKMTDSILPLTFHLSQGTLKV